MNPIEKARLLVALWDISNNPELATMLGNGYRDTVQELRQTFVDVAAIQTERR